MAKQVFIDGESGTTGLEIFKRLRDRPDLHIIRLPPEQRKDREHRAAALNQADLAILCLPDDAAIEAVSMVTNPNTRILDASTAHRTHPDWVYGFAEMTSGQYARVSAAKRVANPGCYATGAIAILRPLVDAGVLAPDHPVTLNAVSGYTGGGKSLIDSYENTNSSNVIHSGFYEYGLTLEHKHVPEIAVQSGLSARPLFVPSVGRFPQGMLVNLPLQLRTLGMPLTGRDLVGIFERHYAFNTSDFHSQVRVQRLIAPGVADLPTRLEADALAGTDWLDIHVIANDKLGQAVVTASLDNLGKGACGAAIQNIGLMLGIPDLAETMKAAI